MLLYILGSLLCSVGALYTEKSIIITVDVTIKTVSPLIAKANAHIPQIIQSSFQNTNRDALYLYMIPISNITCNGDENSFRYHALLNVYFISESEFSYALTKYEDILSNDMNSFIERYQNNIYNELLRILNVDSLGNNAVIINTLNMIQGEFIVNYAAKRTPFSSTVHPNIAMRATSDTDAYIKENIVLFVIIGGLIMFVCFCCTIGCFWCSDRVQKSDLDSLQKRENCDNMLETETLTLHPRNTNTNDTKMDKETAGNNERSATKDTDTESRNEMDINKKDPFQWNTDEVMLWLKEQGLFSSVAASNMNGKDLLISPAQKCVETNDKLAEGIKKLRLESNTYSLWKFESEINKYNDENSYSSNDSNESQDSMDNDIDCSCIQKEEEEAASDSNAAQSPQSISKKKRKPPRKLRQRASMKRRKRTEITLSPSSTMDIGRRSVDIININDRNIAAYTAANDNKMEYLTVRRDTLEFSNGSYATTEGSMTENRYDSEDHQLYR